jgi:uncharacterized protein YaaR (DUF327 family)
MELFEKQVRFDPQRIHRLIAKQAGKDLSGLTEPCYAIKTKLFEATLYRELGIQKKDVSAAARRLSKDTKFGQVVKVPLTFTLAYIYYRFARANNRKMAEDIITYTLIKHYGSMFDRMLPRFCDPDVFRYAMENVVAVHIFRREKTIPNAIAFWAKGINERYFNKVRGGSPEPLLYYIIECRNKVAQSVKSFSETYYKARDEGKGIGIEKQAEDEDQKNLFQTTTAATGKTAAIERFIKNMFVYKSYDKRALDEAKKISRVKNNLAESVASSIHDKSSEENIKIILTSFLKEILDTKSLCGPDFFKIVKKMMMVRNYKDTYVFKNLVSQFTESLVDRSYSTSRQVTSRDRVNLEMFVAFYITMSFRYLFC